MGYDDVLLVKYCCFKLMILCYLVEMMVVKVVEFVLKYVLGSKLEDGFIFKYIFIVVKWDLMVRV